MAIDIWWVAASEHSRRCSHLWRAPSAGGKPSIKGSNRLGRQHRPHGLRVNWGDARGGEFAQPVLSSLEAGARHLEAPRETVEERRLRASCLVVLGNPIDPILRYNRRGFESLDQL